MTYQKLQIMFMCFVMETLMAILYRSGHNPDMRLENAVVEDYKKLYDAIEDFV